MDSCSIEDARKMHGKRVVQKAENRIFDIEPDAGITFQELADWYPGLENVKARISLRGFLIP